MKPQNIAIIGAGITGLSLGYYLKQAGIPFTIFEKAGRTGGVIKTKQQNGFIYETGPNSGVLSNVETLELIDRLNGKIQLQTGNESAKKRLIWKKNRWEALPSGLISAIKTPLFTFKDKINILGEPFRPKGNNPHESLSQMVLRRMGKSFLDYAIDPFISGIYAGDPDYLVPKYALPKLYQLEQEYGSFIKGAIKKAKIPKTEQEKRVTKDIFSFEGGLQSLVDALTNEIGDEHIQLNRKDLKIQFKNNKYLIDNKEFTKVVSTVNASVLPGLFPFVPATELQDITSLKYAKVVEASIGFKNWQGMDVNAFGGLIPMREKRDILGVLFMSSIFSGRAPEGGALLTIFLGGTRREELTELNESQLFDVLKKEVGELMQVKEFKPDLFELNYYNKAIAQYGADSGKRLEAIEKLERKYPGLIIAGSLKDGVGIADRIKQATQTAQKLINDTH